MQREKERERARERGGGRERDSIGNSEKNLQSYEKKKKIK